MEFKKTVLIIAIVLLIGTLIFLGSMMASKAKDAAWPPKVASCPDFWEEKGGVDKNGNSLVSCNNVHDLGKSSCKKIMNFSADMWQGSEGDCRKSNWAKNCDLTWDGITNRQVCKTETTSPGSDSSSDSKCN